MEPPPAKKPRPLAKSWKLFHLTNLNARNGKTFGLQDLFAHGFDSSAGPGAARTNSTDPRAGGFYTLRLEHRQGGPAAQFQGEERILLFADARSVGKIIFSSQLPESSATNRKPSLVDAADNAGLNAEKETHPIHYLTAHAKIHVLEVKSQLRGRDLGGLLFSAAITSLKSKYCIEDDCDVEREEKREGKMSSEPIESIGCKQLYDVQCILDAEEDVTRHGKLVSFYENLGCRVKPSKRVQYINNNDSETYRKVPMQIDLHPPAKANSLSKQERDRMRRRRFTNMVASKGSFLPVQLVGPLGKLSVCSYASEELIKLNWLIKEAPEGIQFCTTHGHLLVASPSGSVSVLSPDEEDNDNDSDLDIDTCVLNKWTYFVPCHISDTDDNAEGDGCSQSSDSSNSLWVLRTFFGHFLTADSIKQTLSCTRLPSFWQANGESLSLVCTTDTPARRHHYRKSWVQTYDYVNKMRSRFLSFSLGKATLFEALGWMSAFPAYPFNAWCSNEHIPGSNSPSPSLRTLCFLMAEAAREEGLPDWVQLVALFHELGESVKILDPSSTGEMAESIYDWTISSRSRVIGCKAPHRATFSEFRHLNMDEQDPRYNSDTGVYEPNCGLENVFLMWSGCEYMYHLLKHNNAALPEEAYAMLRYFLLGDWHEHHEFAALTNVDDDDVLTFVQEFDALRRRVRLRCVNCGDLSDEECSLLWHNQYAGVASKFGCDHVFDW